MQLPRKLAERAALKDLDAIYRLADEALAPFGCAESADCCNLTRTGRQPYLWPVELLKVQKVIAARGGKVVPREDGACPLLSAEGRCTIYADRPFGCRTFFCERVTGPGNLPRQRLVDLTRRLTDVAERLDPVSDGPRALFSLLFKGGVTGPRFPIVREGH